MTSSKEAKGAAASSDFDDSVVLFSPSPPADVSPSAPTPLIRNTKKSKKRSILRGSTRRRRPNRNNNAYKDFFQALLGILTLKYFIEVFQHARHQQPRIRAEEKKRRDDGEARSSSGETTIAVGSF